MWIERETALLSVDGTEPPILPEQISTTLIWIDDHNSVSSVCRKKCRLSHNTSQSILEGIQHIVVRATRNQPEYEFTEALLFAIPIRINDIHPLSQTKPSELVTHFSTIIDKHTIFSSTPESSGSNDTKNLDTRLMAPSVFHHAFHIWLLFNKIKMHADTDHTQELTGMGIQHVVDGWYPGRKTLKYSRRPEV
jgi:hypothetical protein